MRVVVAPDKFAGSLSAAEASRAFQRGWLRVRPDDELDLAPLSDGGPGFLDCLFAALGGDLLPVRVTGPLGEPVPAHLLVVPAAGSGTAYVESSQANGLHLVPPDRRDPLWATTFGVGELVASAIRSGARTVLVGLGGSATNDGGAGMLAALGARGLDAAGEVVPLDGGPGVLDQLAALDLAPALACVRDCRLVIATDVDSPLLGPRGASRGFGRQKGADGQVVAVLESRMDDWRRRCEQAGTLAELAQATGAGAAGGLGYGFLLLGAERVSGIKTVLSAVSLERRCAGADLVVTGEGRFDWQSLHGKVVSGVVRAAGGVPVVVVAGQSLVPPADWRGLGISQVRTLVDEAGSVDRAVAEAAATVEAVAADLAQQVSE